MATAERRLIRERRSTMMLCLSWWLIGGAFANVVTREYPEEPKIDKLNGRPNIDASELIGGHTYAEMDTFRRSGGYIKEFKPPYGSNGYGGQPRPPPYANRPSCEFYGSPYNQNYHGPKPYHNQEHHDNHYNGHKSSGYGVANNDNFGYVKQQKKYSSTGYGQKHSNYGGDNSYLNNDHHPSNYENGNSYGGGSDYYGKQEHYDHHNSDTNVYDVVAKSKETVEDVYDQKMLKNNYHHVDLSDLIYPLHIPHSKADYSAPSSTAGYDQPYGGQGGYSGSNAYSEAPIGYADQSRTPHTNPPPPQLTTTTAIPINTANTDARKTITAGAAATFTDSTTTTTAASENDSGNDNNSKENNNKTSNDNVNNNLNINSNAASITSLNPSRVQQMVDALPEPGPQTICNGGAFAAVGNCSAFFRCATDTTPDAPLGSCWRSPDGASMVFDGVAGKCLRFDALPECSNLAKLCSSPNTPWRIVGKQCSKVALNCDNKPPTICSAKTKDVVNEFGRCGPPSNECRQMMARVTFPVQQLL